MYKRSLTKITELELDTIRQQIEKYRKSAIQPLEEDFPKSNGKFPTLHQHFMVQELLRAKGLLVASSTGSGKTLIGWLAYHALDKKLQERNARALVICPNQAADSAWTQEELNKYSQILKKREQSVVRVKHISDLERAVEADFLVINDDKLGRTKDPLENEYIKALSSLGKNYFDLITLDEGHREKNYNSNRTKGMDVVITAMNPESLRLILTATPTWNTPNDIGMLLHFLDPKTIANPQLFDYTRDYDAAAQVIGRYMYRLTREELRKIISLPGFKTRVHEVSLSSRARKEYTEIWKNQKNLLRYIWDAREILAEEKLRYLQESELVEKIARGSMDGKGRRQVVIFTQVREKADGFTRRLEEMYIEKGLKVIRIDGTVPVKRREKLAELFRWGEVDIAIVTSKTMGEGTPLNTYPKTNLPVSVVSLDEEFAPGERYQKEGRVIRPKQVGTVVYHELRAVDNKLSQVMKDCVKALGQEHGRPISERVLKHFQGTTLDQDIDRMTKFKMEVNEKVLRGARIDELEALLASFNPNARNVKFVLPFCIYSNLVNLIPTDTPSHVATLIATRWNGMGVEHLESLIDQPLQKLYIDMYEANYEYTSSAHSARLLNKIMKGLEEKMGAFRNIVDLGSGAAYVSRITGRAMTCVDIWKRMLDRGKEECLKLSKKKKALKENNYLQRRLQHTGLPSQGADVVIASYSLQYQLQGKDSRTGKERRELEDAILEANRLLLFGGFWCIALPRTLAKAAYERFNEKLNQFGFVVTPLSGEYVVKEAYDVQGKTRIKKSPADTRFKSVYITIAQKTGDANGYLQDPNSIVLYRPKSVGLSLGIRGKMKGKENIDPAAREICTDFGVRQGTTIVGVEKLVQHYVNTL